MVHNRSKQYKKALSNSLVTTSSVLIKSIWKDGESIKSLNSFTIALLSRSKSTNLTLQVALYYLIRLSQIPSIGLCKKRIFLSSLILASKYVQDKNYSMKSWALISGIPASELVANEMLLLKCLKYNVHLKHEIFVSWSNILSYFVLSCSKINVENRHCKFLARCQSQWLLVLQHLSPDSEIVVTENYVQLMISASKVSKSAKKDPLVEAY